MLQLSIIMVNTTLPTDVILQGDCIEVLKSLPSKSIDLIFADPPYNMQTEGDLLRTDGSTFNGVTDKWDKFESLKSYDEFCKLWLFECQRVLKSDGSIWVIGSFQNIYRLGYIMQDLGFWILNDIIWSKPNAVPNFAGTRFQNSHETLLWCSKKKNAKYCFHYQTMKHINSGKQMKSVWDIGICIGNERLKDENGQKIHSTQKPEDLLSRIILASSEIGDTVLDPFFGTGTTGAIAKKYGRHYIGIERETKYIEAAKHRIESVKFCDCDETKNVFDIKPPKFSIQQLIELGFLKEGQLLYSKDKSKSVKICHDSKVLCLDEMLSIHKASAKLLDKTNNNGWDYFWCEYNGAFISINDLRYKAQERSNNEHR